MAGIKTIDPSMPTYGKLTAFLSDTHPDRLKQLADANIPFLSNLARNRLPKNEYNSSGNKWGSPEALKDFTREHGGPRDHAAEQRGFNRGAREIARLRRQGK
jgi:hypothetical protein